MKRLILIVPFILVSNAYAQWTLDGEGVCAAPGNQTQPVIISDMEGGWIMTWVDGRGADLDIYAQRLDASGMPSWTANGVVVCSASNTQTQPRIVADASGGAIVTWQDLRTGTYDIYAQHIDSDGTLLWAANGVPICTATGTQQLPAIAMDWNQGAIITWTDFRNGASNGDIYAQRVNYYGAVQWTANGVAVCSAAGTQDVPTIVLSPFVYSSVVIAWADQRYSITTDVYAQRVSLGGVPQWSADGVPVCAMPGNQDGIVMVSDVAGGALLAWRDMRTGPVNADIYEQRINAAGVTQWADGGIPIHTGAQDYGETRKAMLSDGAGGAFVVWEDWRNYDYDIYAQYVNSAGVVQWIPNGVAVSAAFSNQSAPAIASDAAGGAIIAWLDQRSGSEDIYAQRMGYNGFPQWTANGVPVCAATGNQENPAIADDGSHGAVLAWEDLRSGSRDIYAQRMTATGEQCAFVVTKTTDDDTPGTLRAAIRQTNAIPGLQTVSFNIPGPGSQTILLNSQLPAITDDLVMDGFTQPGATPNTNPVGSACNAHIIIDIDGGFTSDGFKFQAPGTLRGVALHAFTGSDVVVQADPVVIEGNYIGLDSDGFGGYQNHTGILIQANNCHVGGATAAARNVITETSYSSTGIQIEGAWYTQIAGNYIGSKPDLTSAGEGNTTGILIEGGGRSNTVGFWNDFAPDPQQANIIAYNYTAISIVGAGTIDNGVFGNSFRNNTAMGIDLGGDFRTPNDIGDGDDGPNHMQNFPVVSAATGSQVTGVMHGAPGASVILHFYWTSSCYPGNGDKYMGSMTVDLNGAGDAPFTFTPAQPIPPSYVTANTRDWFGNTSEMSDCIYAVNTPGGANVMVPLVDANGTSRGTATFAQVTSGNNTFVVNPFTPAVPVSGYAIGNPNNPAIYYDIYTLAGYSGGVDVCLKYDENSIPGPEANLVLLHYENSMWRNVTTSRDLVNNMICGHVTTLSPFVIGAVTTTGVNDEPIPNRFALHGNVPNPFNPTTTIRYDVPRGGADVNITVYDVSGRLVRELVNEHRAPGNWSVEWNGEDDRGARVASGVYFYRMRAGEFVETRKMVLLK